MTHPLGLFLEDDSISSTSKTCICSYLGKGARFGWLLGHLSIHLISHILFSPQHWVFVLVWFNP
jgi:hypothetical protein